MALIALMVVAPSRAGAVDLTWKIYKPTNTGLQGNYVYSILLDSLGTLWAAANDPVWDEGGLASFDGVRWRNWSTVDGAAPSFELRSLVRDRQGNIWAGSPVGLVKFDGTGFTLYDNSKAPFPSNVVRDVALDSLGNVWFAMNDFGSNQGGLGKFDGVTFTFWTRANGLPWPAPWNGVESVAVGNGVVYVGSDVVGAAKFDGKKWTYYDPNGRNPPPSNWISAITVEPGGTVWMGSGNSGAIGRLSGSDWTYITMPGASAVFQLVLGSDHKLYVAAGDGVLSWDGQVWTNEGWPGSSAYSLAFAPDRSMWAAGIGGVAHRVNGVWTQSDVANTGLTERFINGIGHETGGAVWFATGGGGACRFDGTVWQDFNPNNHGAWPWPMPTDGVDCIVQDLAGIVWVGTKFGGLGAWNGSTWTTYLPNTEPQALAVATDGSLWGVRDGTTAFRFDGTTWTSQAIYGAQRVASDRQGNDWLGAYGLFRWTGAGWAQVSSLPGTGWVYALAAGPDGRLWVGTDAGLGVWDGTSWTIYTTANSGLPANVITSIAISPQDVVWVGTFDGNHYPYTGGLARFDGTAWSTYTTANSPLPHNQVQAVDVAGDGRVWVGTQSQGVAVITEHDVAAVPGPVVSRDGLALAVPVPNPARGGVAFFAFTLPSRAWARLELFDIGGRLARTVVDGPRPAGPNTAAVDLKGLAPGVYVVRLAVPGRQVARRLTVLR